MTRKATLTARPKKVHCLNSEDEIMCGLPRMSGIQTTPSAKFTTCQACIGKMHPAFRPTGGGT